jgi:hypothetical protein
MRTQSGHHQAIRFDAKTCTLLATTTDAEREELTALYARTSTWDDVWWQAPAANLMLDLLRHHWDLIPVAPETELRRFTLRCIDALPPVADPGLARIVRAARSGAKGPAALDYLVLLQEEARHWVTVAGVRGLPRLSATAAAALAIWHVATRDPYESAYWTAEFTARCHAYATLALQAASWPLRSDVAGEEPWHTARFAAARPDLLEKAVREPRERLADLLRSLVPNPFALLGGPVRAEVFQALETNEMNKRPLYCRYCGAARTDVELQVISDIRRTRCASCRLPLEHRPS